MQKIGMDIDSIEDATATHPGDERFVVAIADGASQAFEAARWARLLAERYVVRPQVSRISQSWLDPVKDEYRARIDFASLPWHALEKASRGSFATLLGLVIDHAHRRYRAIAVGDSCLVTLDETDPKMPFAVFPRHLADAAAFTDSPYLIATNPAYNARLPRMQHRMGWRPLPERATFLLMTDALAAWFIDAHRRGEEPRKILTSLRSHEQFEEMVTAWRAAGRLRDDDTTLLVVRVSEGAA